ncbi:MAG: hypothetical protein AMXMBFR84_05900 [Candidatus Hydrogenedentota bacterium]
MLEHLQTLPMTLQNPSMFHAAIVHFPIALSVLLVPLVYATLAVESKALRGAAVAGFAILTATALLSMRTGDFARDKLSNTLPKDIWDHINLHASMGEKLWMFGLAGTILMSLTLVESKSIRKTMQWLSLGMSLAIAGWTGLLGHLGGTLLYDHGVGAPGTPVSHLAPTPADSADPADTAPAEAPAPMAAWDAPVDDGFTPKRLPFTLAEAESVKYEKDVVPLLEFYCYECHRARRKEGELDMTTIESMLKGGKKSGPSIIPGDPDASPLIRYIRGELQPQMPEDEEPLADDELHLLRQWIAAGARTDGETSAQ